MPEIRGLDLIATHQHMTVTGPGMLCAFNSRACSASIRDAGGFDLHHPWPKGMGGADQQVELVLCPNHHRRQHALIRAMVEVHPIQVPVALWRKFTKRERLAATLAVQQWIKAGMPPIAAWPTLAAS